MNRTLAASFLTGLLCAIAPAATTNSNIALTGTGTSATGNYTVTGTVTLSAFGNGTISSQFNSSALLTASVPLTLNITSGSTTGTLTATFSASPTVLLAILTGSSTATGTGTIAITAGTGGFAGATGSFTVSGAGSGTGSTSSGSGGFTITGSGSITLPGSTGSTGGTGGTGGTGTSSAPTITAIQDAASYTNSVAQGSIFVIKGANLSASGFIQNNGFPLSTTLGGVSVSLALPGGGAGGGSAYMIYLYNQNGVNQLAALMPSSIPPGNYNVLVTNNGVTGSIFAVTVVKAKPGLITRDSTGSGLAVVQNYVSPTQLDVDAYTTQSVGGTSLSPAKPGQTLIAYGTGFGPDTGADNVASPGYNFLTNGAAVQVMVGGMPITPDYAGRTPGSAGLDQINFNLPANVPTGCNVSFQVSVNGTSTPMTYLAIAPSASATACVQPGFTTAQLQQFDQGGSYTSASFSLVSFSGTFALPNGPFTGKDDFFSGQFSSFSGMELSQITSNPHFTPQGACTITTSAQGVTPAASGTNLDAGAISVAGPSGSGLNGPLVETSSLTYNYNLGFETPVSTGVTGLLNTTVQLLPGNYTLTGAGGKDVGKFTASVTLGSPVTIAGGLPSTITRASGVTVNWTGGNPTDWVELDGTAAGSPTTSFTCFGSIGDGKLTVPASVLNQLPASANGTLYFTSGPNASFTAPLTAGGTVTGSLGALVGSINNTVSYK